MITDPAQRRKTPHLVAPPQPSQTDIAAPWSAIAQHATMVRLRRRQVLSFANARLDSLFVVQSGLLALQTAIPGKPRQLLSLHYPGDVIGLAVPPPLPQAALYAIVPSELWRLPKTTLDGLLAHDPALSGHITRRLSVQGARALLHTAMIGALSGDERATSFLIEQGLVAGTPSAHGVSFDMHLSRNDVADYLALNADTLSRIMSRLKTRGLVAQAGRTRMIVPNWNALCAESPIADALIALHAENEH